MVHFLVHHSDDSVGVATLNIKTGEEAIGKFLDTQKTVRIQSRQDIPLAHKIALKQIKKGETILKYGHDIGEAYKDIETGEHVHTQNLKTKRW